ncbi:uncharacterized protein MYCFIDRAFT_203857 [Pseudocercospora fijiensis CIRAD86]|uniref:Uncharacterized protein n=1 Tax=Pseudocercospora fijiensis (strain CIRAD86) TaxID=383855 RepID=M3AWT8_PSEFD|nr:uncharacterized protein MYCFIDRAFT_203857 [Pseudocercospora fijiensis CIRAD86]EME81932.1 hypothetical protein MYCFIDRAFT_203857 [Pseudocercospora fijiensis CIRAD86]
MQGRHRRRRVCSMITRFKQTTLLLESASPLQLRAVLWLHTHRRSVARQAHGWPQTSPLSNELMPALSAAPSSPGIHLLPWRR